MVLFVSPALAGSALASAITVTTTADNTDPCSGLHCPSLRSAVLKSNALGGTNTIRLPAGQIKLTLTPSGPDDGHTGDLHLTTSVTILGHGDGVGGTKLVGDTDRIFDITSTASKVTLSGLMLTGGSGETFGGAIQANGAKLTLTRDAFIGNATAPNGFGGAVSMSPPGSATLIINSSLFRSNTAAMSNTPGPGFGGAISFEGGNNGTMTITNSEFDSNTAQAGNNPNGGFGGAIDFEASGGSTLTVTGSTFAANKAIGGAGTSEGGFGGAIEFEPSPVSTLNVTNSTFSSNQATGSGSFGGAIDFEPGTGSSGTLTQVTIAGNSVTTAGDGGGVYAADSPLTIRNSIISGNTGAGSASNCTANSGGSLVLQGHNLELGTSCGFDINANPLLKPLAANGGQTRTRALAPTSPARDHAAKALCPATDQRGVHRPDDPGTPCDIGAFEFAKPAVAITSPANGAMVTRGSRVVARFRCTEGGITSPIAICRGTVPNGHAIDTSTVGTKAFTVTATDRTGQRVTKTVHYTVTK
jgi:hypothetical protein